MYALLPSPRSCSKFACCSTAGHFAYGSKHNIILIKSKGEVIDIDILDCKKKVVSVTFSDYIPTDSNFFLASATINGSILVWDIKTKSVCIQHDAHRQEKGIVAIDWTRAGDFQVVSTDKEGGLKILNTASGEIKSLPLLKNLHLKPTSLACSKTHKALVAIGCVDGLIAVVNIEGTGSVLSVLDGHDDSILSISWCPLDTKTEDPQSTYHQLLFASATSECVAIWNTDERRCVKSFCLQEATKPSTTTISDKLPVSILWLHPNVLVTSNTELLQWNPLSAHKSEPLRIHKWHHHYMSCIAAQADPNNCETYNLWTMGADNHLVCSTVLSSDCNQSTKIYTIGLLPYGREINCLSVCPNTENTIAVSTEKSFIHMLVLGKSSDTYRIKLPGASKLVSSFAWHPTEKLSLAFATKNGHLGYIHEVKHSATPKMFMRAHLSRVRSLCWGPPTYVEGTSVHNSGLHLYCTSSNDALSYDPKCLDNEGDITHINLRTVILSSNPSMSKDDKYVHLAWKSDYTLLAVVLTNKPTIQVLSAPYLKCQGELELVDGHAAKIAWHPNTQATSEQGPYDSWLAVVKQSKVVVYSVCIQEDNRGLGATTVIATLCGHTKSVQDLSWNPEVAGWLATSSLDSTIKLWDVASGSLLMTFEGHSNSVESIAWSCANKGLLLSGSLDCTVRSWQLPENLQNGSDQQKMSQNNQHIHQHIAEKDFNIESAMEIVTEEHIKIKVKQEDDQDAVEEKMDVVPTEHLNPDKTESKEEMKVIQSDEEEEDVDMQQQEGSDKCDSDDVKEASGKRKKRKGGGRAPNNKPISTVVKSSTVTTGSVAYMYVTPSNTTVFNLPCTLLYDLENPAFSVAGAMYKCWIAAIAIAGKPLHWWTNRYETCLKNTNSLVVNGNVRTMLWNPLQTNELAFGTDQGYIGFYSVIEMEQRKHLTSFQHFPETPVHRVGWGPCTHAVGTELPRENKFSYLYATNGIEAGFAHRMILHKKFHPLRPIITASNPKWDIKAKHTDFSWNCDYSLLALGLDDGSVLLLAPPHLEIVHILKVRQMDVQLLSWHPIVVTETSNPSQERRWLATGGDDNNVVIFDVSPLALKERKWRRYGDVGAEVNMRMSVLCGHSAEVTCLEWNSNISGLLVTGSVDCTVKVWHVPREQLLFNLMGHSAPVLSVSWYNMLTGCVLATSLDTALRIWRLPSSTASSRPKKWDIKVNMRSEFIGPDKFDSC